jgi:hypothetical protein
MIVKEQENPAYEPADSLQKTPTIPINALIQEAEELYQWAQPKKRTKHRDLPRNRRNTRKKIEFEFYYKGSAVRKTGVQKAGFRSSGFRKKRFNG